MGKYINVDITSLTNGRTNIPVINKIAPVYDMPIEKETLLQLLQFANLTITVSQTKTTVTGENIIKLYNNETDICTASETNSTVSNVNAVTFSNGDYSSIKIKSDTKKTIYPITGSLIGKLSNDESLMLTLIAIEVTKNEVKIIGMNNLDTCTLTYKYESTAEGYSQFRWSLPYTANSINGVIMLSSDIYNKLGLEFIK